MPKVRLLKALKNVKMMNIPVQAGYVVLLMAVNVIMIPLTIYHLVTKRTKPLTKAEENRITQLVVDKITKEMERGYEKDKD
jgi:hypothetical protein